METMTKTQVVEIFKKKYSKLIARQPVNWYERRYAWFNFIELLHSKGKITDKQLKWSLPQVVKRQGATK